MKAAFIFVAPEVDVEEAQTTIVTPHVELITAGVPSYKAAKALAVKLVEEGVKVIELCAGFGNRGTALITEAVAGKADVGVVRFDNHPGLDGQSGDELFS